MSRPFIFVSAYGSTAAALGARTRNGFGPETAARLAASVAGSSAEHDDAGELAAP